LKVRGAAAPRGFVMFDGEFVLETVDRIAAVLGLQLTIG
jgi:hypothetical protein